jgi:phosphoserine aminotransferase
MLLFLIFLFKEDFQLERVYNFSAGPSVLPLPVLGKAKEELVNANGSGMSVMEMSHRSEACSKDIIDEAEVASSRTDGYTRQL